jgi:hypothetical protein
LRSYWVPSLRFHVFAKKVTPKKKTVTKKKATSKKKPTLHEKAHEGKPIRIIKLLSATS